MIEHCPKCAEREEHCVCHLLPRRKAPPPKPQKQSQECDCGYGLQGHTGEHLSGCPAQKLGGVKGAPDWVHAEEYAESCDNDTGSFLSEHLIKIREKAFLAGCKHKEAQMRGEIAELKEALEVYVTKYGKEAIAYEELKAQCEKALDKARLEKSPLIFKINCLEKDLSAALASKAAAVGALEKIAASDEWENETRECIRIAKEALGRKV